MFHSARTVSATSTHTTTGAHDNGQSQSHSALVEIGTQRHAHVKNVIAASLRKVSRTDDLAAHILCGEPVFSDYWKVKQGAEEKVAAKDPVTGRNIVNRADIAVFLAGHTHLLDVVITHPVAASNPKTATTAGAAAAAAFNAKDTHYNNLFDVPVGKMVPIAFETGGFTHPDTTRFFQRFVKWGLATGNNTQPEWTTSSRTEYAARLRSICVSVSLALARTVANSLIDGSCVLRGRGATLPPGAPGA